MAPEWQREWAEDLAWSQSWASGWEQHRQWQAQASDLMEDMVLSAQQIVVQQDGVSSSSGFESIEDQLHQRWRQRGYLSCDVAWTVSDSAAYLRVEPGPLFHLATIQLQSTGDQGLDTRLERRLPQPGSPLEKSRWDRAVTDLLVIAGNAGYPFARWRVRDLSVDPRNHQVTVTGEIALGERAWLGDIHSNVTGRGAQRFLLKVAGLKPGTLFRESDLALARRRLLLRGHWSQVDPPTIYAVAADTVAVQWIVRKRPNPNRLAAILGLSRDDQDSTRLSGQVQLLLANIAGTGRRLELDWSDDGADRSHLGVSWLEPLVLGTPLDTELLLDQEVLQGVHTRFQSDVRVNLPVAGVWGVELGFGRDRSTFPTGEWARSSRLRSRVAIHHRRFDLSVSGWQAEVAVESAKRQAETRPEEGAQATALQQEQQTLLQVDLDGEIWLGGTLSLGLRGHYAGVNGDEESVPLTEQYRLGGARSLRGYREDQFHGEQVASVALELRVGRAGGSRLYTFLDVGYVRHSRINPETDLLDTSIDYPEGFGVGIETAGIGGDISLAIGFPGTFGLDEAKLHVSLVQAF